MRGIGPAVMITRPHNVAIAAGAVAVGALTGPGPPADAGALGWAALAAALITAGGNTLNDVVDVAVDAINKPGRPLPSGRIDRSTARWLAIALLATGLAAALPLSTGCFGIAAGSIGLIVLYDLWGGGWPLVGNLLVSLLTATAFLFGSLATGGGIRGLIPGVFAFFFDLGREIIKDLEDAGADRAGGLRTLPIVRGERAARYLARGALLALLAVLPVPVLAGWLDLPFLLIVAPGVGVPVVLIAAGLSRPREAAAYRRYQIVLKVDMIVGLLAVLAG